MELLVVLALIGLLAGLLMPALAAVQERGRKAAAAHQLRQLALSYISQPEHVQHQLAQVASLAEWAGMMARAAGLDDVEIYRVRGDLLESRTSAVPPRRIGVMQNGVWRVDPGFAEWPLAVSVATGVFPGRSPATTPLLWTRGLEYAGRWSGRESGTPAVFGEEGGFIAFLDGRVVFYEDLTLDGGQLRDFQSGEWTHDIRRALPPGARILDGSGGESANPGW